MLHRAATKLVASFTMYIAPRLTESNRPEDVLRAEGEPDAADPERQALMVELRSIPLTNGSQTGLPSCGKGNETRARREPPPCRYRAANQRITDRTNVSLKGQ
jgi:hypothetical protein